MRNRCRSLTLAFLFSMAASVPAATLYWDTNGSTGGAGGATPSGAWDGIATNFNTDATGAGGGTIGFATTTGDTIVFSAGTDATGSYTITVSGTQAAGGLVFEDGSAIVTGGTLDFGTAARTIQVNGGLIGTINSVVSGVGAGITKTGLGTLTLGGVNTYTGATTIQGGSLVLDGNTGSLNSASNLTISGGGGTFNYLGAAGGSTQILGALSFAAGAGTVQSTYGGGGTSGIGFASLAARTAGATGNFVVNGGTNGSSNGIVLTGVAAGFINQGLFFNGADFAFMDGAGTFVRGINYGVDAGTATSAGGATLGATGHLQATGSITAQTTTSLNTLKLSGATNVAIVPGNTVTLASGGLLKSGGGSGFINSGTLTAGVAELVIRADQATDKLNLYSVIGGSGGITITGAGTVNLANLANTFTGNIFVNGATLAWVGTNSSADPIALGAAGARTITVTGGGRLSPTFTTNPTAGTKSFVIGTGGGTINVASGVTFSLDDAGQFGGTGDLTVTGTGTGIFNLGNGTASVFTGNVTVNSGTLQLRNGAGALGTTSTGRTITIANGATMDLIIAGLTAIPMTVSGVGVSNVGVINNSGTAAGSTAAPITLAGNAAFGSASTFGLTLSGPISGAFDVTKVGAGTGALTLSGLNTYTGRTIVNAGTLVADAATVAAPINSASALVFSGTGTFQYKGLAATARAMVLNGLTLAGGAATVDANNLGTTTTLDLSGTGGTLGITRALGGGTVDFKAATGTLGTTALIKTAQANDATGILGAWATVGGGANLAAVSGGNVVAYTGYTDIVALGGTIADGSSTNVRINAAGTTGNIALAAVTTNINSLFQNTTTAATVDTAGKTLRLGVSGGILTSSVASTTGTVTIGTAANSGTLTAGGGAVDVAGEIIFSTSTTAGITVNATIADNGLGVVSVTKSGLAAGTLTLNGTNTYTGATSINAGTINVASLADINTASSLGKGSVAGSASDLVLNGGSLQFNTGAAPVSTNRLFSVGLGGGTLDSSNATAANTMSFTGTGSIGYNGQSGARVLTLAGTNTGNNILAASIGDNGGPTQLTKSGTGTWILTGNNTYSGTTTVSAGTLQVGNGGTTGSLGTGLVTGAATGVIAFNRSDNVTVNNVFTTGVLQLNSASTLALNNSDSVLTALRFGTTGVGVDGGVIDLLADVGLSSVGGTGILATFNGTINASGGGRLLINSSGGAGNGMDWGAVSGKTLTINAVIANGAGSPNNVDFYGGTNATGVVILTADNTFTGAADIFEVVQVSKIGNQGVAGNLGAGTTIQLGGSTQTGSTLRYTGAGETTDRILDLGATTGAGIIEANGAGALVFSTNLTASGAGAKTLTLTGTSTANNAINGVIINNSATNTTAVSKTGVGTWVLGAANTYTGATSVSGGALILNNALAAQNSVVTSSVANSATTGLVFGSGIGAFTVGGLGGSQNLALSDSASVALTTLTIGGTNTTSGSYSGVLSGSANLIKAGTITQTFTGANTITGTVTINGGILALNNEAALGPNPGAFNAGQLTLNGGSIGAAANTAFAIDDANRGITVGASGGGFDAAAGAVLTVANAINGGTNAITKSGTGVVIFTAANTYGTTTVTGGRLILSGAGTLGSGALTLNGGGFEVQAGTSAVTIGASGGSLVYTPGITTDLSAGLTLTAGGTLTVDVISNATTVVYANAFGSATTAALSKVGAGGLTLRGGTGAGNTFTGGVVVGAGTLTIDFATVAAPGSGVVASTNALTLRGGTLAFLGKAATTDLQTFASTALLEGGSTISATQNTATSLGANLGTISRDGTTNKGTVNFVLPTTGSYAVGNTNNTSGILGGWATVAGTSWATVSGGNIAAYAGEVALPATGGGATTNYSYGAATTITGNLTANAIKFTTTGLTIALGTNTLTMSGNSGGLLVGVAAATISGTTTTTSTGFINAGASGELMVYTNSGSTLTISAGIGGTVANFGLTKSGAGTLSLTNAGTTANNYTGATVINGGTLTIDAANRLGGSSGITLNGGTLNSSSNFNVTQAITLGLNGGTLNYNSTAGSGGWSSTTAIALLGSGSRTLTLGGTDTGRLATLAAAIGDSGGPTSLVINGGTDTSIFVLSAANSTYTGATTLTRGVLRLAAANAASPGSNIVFNGGTTNRAILEFNATYGSSFTESLGTLPGQVQWTGNGGFSSSNVANFLVNLGGNATPSTVTWAAGSFVPTGSVLQFAQASANQNYGSGSVTFQNPIDLNGASRTIDVGDNSNQNEVTLSGLISGAAGSVLSKTGLGNLTLSANNSGSTNVGVTVTSGGGSVIFSSLNAIPGTTGANVTITGGSVVLTGSANPLFDMGSRIVTSSAGSILLDTNSSATLDFSSFSALSLGAYNATMGQSVIFTGSINPNSNTYRLGSGRSTVFTAAVTGNTLINYALDQGRNAALVLPAANQLPDGGSARSLVVGSGATYLTSYNTFSGGTKVGQLTGQAGNANLTIGNDAALGAGLIQFSPTGTTAGTGFIAGTNGDRTISNNVAVGAAGNWVSSGNLASDAVTNSSAITYAGTTALTGAVNIFARTNGSIFLGDITATGTIGPQVTGFVSFLTTPTGAVNKSHVQAVSIAIGGNLIIDSNASLGSGTNTLTIGTGTAAATNTFLRVQAGTSSPVTLTGRTIAVGTNFQPIFDVPGSPVTGVSSTLVLPGVVSGTSTAIMGKIGLGTLTFSGANTFASSNANGLQIFGGTILVDGTASATARVTNATTMALTLGTSTTATAATLGGGGTLTINSGANAISQTFTILQATAKANALNLITSSGQSNLVFNGATFNRVATGGTLEINNTITGGGSTSITLSGTVTSGATTASQIVLDGGSSGAAFIAVNGTDWGARNGTNNIVGLSAIGGYTANTATTLSANADMTSANPTTTLGGATAITSLRFNDASAAGTIDLAGFQLTTGGILVGTGAGANNETISASGAGTLRGAVAGGDLVIIQANTAGNLTISAPIVDNTSATALTKSGAGTLVLSGANTFTGSIFLNGGVLSVASVGTAAAPNPLGQATSAATNLIFNGGSLRFTGASGSTDRGATFNSFSAIEVTGAGATLTMSGAMNGIAAVPGLLQKTGSGTLALGANGGDVDNANLSVLLTAGTLNLNKSSTSAIHAVSGGTSAAALIIGNGGTAIITGSGGDQIFNGSAVVVNGTGKLDLNGQSETIDALAGTGTVTNTGSNGAPITLTLGDGTIAGSQALNGANTPNAAAAGVAATGLNSFSGNITDNGLNTLALNKSGPGTQILSGTGNTYSGDTTITSGTLLLRAANVLPSGSGKGNVNLAGNTVIFGLTVPGILDIGGFNQTINGLSGTAGSIVTNTLATTLSANQTNTLTVGSNDQTSQFDGILQDGYSIKPGTTPLGLFGTLALTKTGAGVLTLTGTSTNTGTVTINQGRIDLNNATGNALATNVTVNTGGTLKLLGSNQLADGKTVTVNGGSFDLNGKTESVGIVLADGAIADGLGGGTLSSNTAFDLRKGTVSAVLGGSSGLNKTTADTVTLSAVNVFAGNTGISAGSLIISATGAINTPGATTASLTGSGKMYVDGSLGSNVAVSVAGGTTLGGRGTVNGIVSVASGGILEAGRLGTGSLTANTVNFAGTATINLFNIDQGVSASLINATNITANGGANSITIYATNSGALANGTYALINYSGTLNDTTAFQTVAGSITGLSGRQNGALNYATANVINLVVSGDSPKWTGFDTALSVQDLVWHLPVTPVDTTNLNWKLIGGGTPTDYRLGDSVLFDDTAGAGNTTVNINEGNVSPTSVTINNSTQAYVFNSSGGYAIAGTTGIVKNGTGTVTINNANTFTGGVVINDGVIKLGNANALGTGNTLSFGTGTTAKLQLFGNNATFTGLSSSASTAVVENGDATTNAVLTVNLASGSNTFAGVLRDAGTPTMPTLALIKSGAGTLILTGANTLSGGNTISGGTLQIGSGPATGTLSGDTSISAGAVLSFNRTGSPVYAGGITGAGSLSLLGGDTLSLTGDAAHSGGTTIAAATTLQIGTGGATGALSGAGAITNNGTLAFNRTGSTVVQGGISGTGALTVGDGTTVGTMILTGSNIYSGSTNINANATLQIGNGGSAGTIGSGTITDNGTLAFDRSDSVTVAAGISGTGSVRAMAGLTTLTGTNSFSNGVLIDSGASLTIGNGSAGTILGVDGAAGGNVTNNGGTLTFNRTGAHTWDNLISGTGGNVTIAAGSWTFTGSNTYTGVTTLGSGTTLTYLNAGAISTASFAGSGALVQSGAGTLAVTGTGTATGTTTIVNGGTIAPSANNALPSGVLILGNNTATVGNLNIGSTSQTIGGLTVNSNTATANTITIGAGGTLTVTGGPAAAVTIGNNSGVGTTTNLTFTGGGSFVVNRSGGTFQVGGATGTTNTNNFTVDMSGLANFTANLGTTGVFRLGDAASTSATTTATFTGAVNNTITAATFGIGDNTGELLQSKTFNLGGGTNVINANTINLGETSTNRGVGVLQFAGAAGTLQIRSASGSTGVANLTMINSASGTTGQIGNSQLLLNGHSVDVSFNNIVMSARSAGTTAGSDATISFDTGTFSANSLSMVSRTGTTFTSGASTGTVNIGGTTAGTTATFGTVTMTTNSVGTAVSTGAVTAALNITGIGTTTITTLNMASDAVSAATSTSASNATVNIGVGGSGGSPNVSLGTVTMSNNTAAATSATTATGTINIAAGTVTATSIAMANTSIASNVSTANLSITGGSLTVNGDITTVNGSGTENTTLTLNGGTLDLTGHNLGSAAGVVGSGSGALNFQSGTLRNVASVNGTAGINKTTTGVLVLGGTNGYAGNTTVTQGVLKLGGNSAIPDGVGFGNLVFNASTGNSATLDLNGFNDTINGLSTTGAGTATIDNTAAGASALTLGGNDQTATYGGAIQNTGGAISLTKIGLGTQTLSGTVISYTGTTTVSSGVLSITGSSGAALQTGSIAVAGGASLLLNNGVGQIVTLAASPGSLNLGAGGGNTTLGLDLGSTSAYDRLVVGGAGTAVTANSVVLNLTGIAGFGVGTYDLLSASSGLSGATYSYAMGGAVAGYMHSLSTSDTLVSLTVTASSGDFYWRGGLNNSWAAFGGGISNWTDSTGTVNYNGTPGTTSTVYFSANGTATPAISTTLDANFTIDNLRFLANPAGVTSVTIAAGTPSSSSLTLTPALGTDGISVADNAGTITISAPVVLGAAQTWTIAGTGVNGSSLAVTGGITGLAANSLTVTGNGILTLAGTSTYAGSTTLNGGSIVAGSTGGFSPNSAYTISASTALRLSGFSNAIGSLAGAGVVENASATTAATLTAGANNTSTLFSGVLQNGGTATLGLTKAGTGALTLSGANTYTGNTTVNAGTLNITGTIIGSSSTSLLNVNPTAGNNAVVNYSGGTSTFFAVTGASVANTASAFYQTGGIINITPGTTTGTQNVAKAVGSYGYLSVTGGVFHDTTGTSGGARFTVSSSGGTGSALTGTGTPNAVIFVGGTGFIDHTNAEWWLNYGLGQITVADSGKIDHTGSSQPFAIFMDSAVTAESYGVLNLAGANAQVITGAQPIRFGNSTTNGAGNSGFVNVAAGTLSVGTNVTTLLPAAPTTINNAYFNFAGGTVKATAALTGWIPVSNASINFNSNIFGAIDNSAVAGAPSFNGGLTVDTNTFAVTIANPLQAPGGAGVTQANLSVTGGSGYIGAPAVIFSSAGVVAGGSPAAGYALVSGGAVTGIVITDPGTYTVGTVPTVTLIGGGGTGASVTASALNTPNVSGGLTKIGAGTLTLSGANTYTGGTAVSAGTLALSASNVLADSGAVLVNGGTFDINTRTETVGAVTLQSGSITGTTGALTGSAYNLQGGTVSAILAGTSGVSKTTTGTVTLSGANTYSGATSITGGTLAFSASGNLGDASATNTIAIDNGTLSYTGSGATDLTATRVLTIGSGGATLDASSATGVLTLSGGIASGSTGNLTKTGPGTVILPGTTVWNGGLSSVTVSDGKLQAGFGTAGIAALNVGATGNMSFQNSLAEGLTLGSTTGALTLAGGSRLGFELGTPGSNDMITISPGGTAVVSGVITLDFFNLGGLASGTYNLISAAGGGLSGATYTLGSGAPSGFSYNFTVTDTLVSLVTSPFTPIYWRGGQNQSWSTLGTASANWTTDSAGLVDSNHTPTAAENVVFSASAAPLAGTSITTTLDGAFTIDSLQVTSSPAGVTDITINPGTGGTLELKPNLVTRGITVESNAGVVTIAAPLTITNAQTWSVDGTGANGSALVISGNTAFNASVTKTGAGAVTLSGANTGTGAFTLSAGTLNLNSNAALGSGMLTLAAGTTIDNTGAAAVTLATNNAQTWNGSFTFTGTRDLNLGTGAVTLGATPTVTTSAGTLTVGGGISGAFGLTKAGAGTLALTGLSSTAASNYSGTTTVDNGTLGITHATTAAFSGGLTFGATAGSTAAGTLDLSGANATFAGNLLVQNNNTTGASITVGAGKTLAVNGNWQIGATTPLVSAGTSKLAIGGGGNLAVTTAAGGTFRVGGTTSTTLSEHSILDLTGLGSANINVSATGTFAVAQPTGGNVAGNDAVLLLPTPVVAAGTAVTTITAANFNVGDSSGNAAGSGQVNSVTLGTGLTTLNVNTINVGTGGRDLGQILYAAGNGSLKVRAADGSSRTALNIGTGGANTGVGAGTGVTNLVDLGGHNSDLLLSTLNLGTQNRGASYANSFTFDTGTLDVTSLTAATRTAESANGAGNARTTSVTINLGGGTVNIANGILQFGDLAGNYTAAGQTATENATLNISGGTVTLGATAGASITMAKLNNGTSTNATAVNALINLTGGTTTLSGNIVKGTTTQTGAGSVSNTATVTLNGASAVLDMSGKNIGDATNTVVFNAQQGTLRNLGQLNGGGALDKTTAGTLTLDTANSYTGSTTVSGGVLQVKNGGALGGTTNGTSVAAGAALEVSNNITTGAEALTLNGGGVSNDGALRNTSGNNTYAGNVTLATDSRIHSDAGRLTVDVASGNAISGSGANLTVSGAGDAWIADSINTGTGGLAKEGAGVLTLAADNGYTGATNVTGGTLQVGNAGAGSTAAGSDVTLNGTAATTVLAGTGTVKGNLNVTSGTVSPGDVAGTGVGTLKVNGSMTLAAGSTMQLKVTAADSPGDVNLIAFLGANSGATTKTYLDSLLGVLPPAYTGHNGSNDFLSVGGSLTLAAGGTVTLINGLTTAQQGDIFHLLDWATVGTIAFGGTFTSVPSDFVLPGLSSGLDWDVSAFQTYGVVSIVPEPGRMMLLFFGLAGLVLRRRRRID